MMTPMRYLFLAFGLILGLHYILRMSHEPYSQATTFSFEKWRQSVQQETKPPPQPPAPPPPETPTRPRRANAVFVVLARNKELPQVIESMKQMEDRFNKQHKYPYVFLNDVPFDEEFRKRTSELTDATASYGLIESSHWNQPSWIDEAKAKKGREKLQSHGIIYADSVSYRNMCRFNSGFFYKHPLLQSYKYYWRIEPGVKYFCDLSYDPFLFMQDNNKIYGFTISLYEFQETIETLWPTVKKFVKENPQYVNQDNALAFISNDRGETYNRCHFWSNFEIGDLDFYRGEAYTKFFEYLDATGGFYYERWGDAPVHSLAASLFLSKHQIHWFKDIGYRHGPYQLCPQGADHKQGKCWCDEKDNFTYDGYSCTSKWEIIF